VNETRCECHGEAKAIPAGLCGDDDQATELEEDVLGGLEASRSMLPVVAGPERYHGAARASAFEDFFVGQRIRLDPSPDGPCGRR